MSILYRKRNCLWWLCSALTVAFLLFFNAIARADLDFGNVNLLMGNPDNAVQDITQPDRFLILKPQYALSYNKDKGIPNWVSWQLNSTWLGDAGRRNNFRSDRTLPRGWYRAKPEDYVGTGFDRGHLLSSEDRGASADANSSTFLMTNILPQSPDNNRGPWLQFESYCRTLIRQGKELYIVAGGNGSGGAGENGESTGLANGKVNVPAAIWKVVLVLNQPGQKPEEIDATARTIGIVVPNQQGIRLRSWRTYRLSVDAIEQTTGYDFFSSIPEEVQAIIEANADDRS
jgi:endonuclease G, mitochondrial